MCAAADLWTFANEGQQTDGKVYRMHVHLLWLLGLQEEEDHFALGTHSSLMNLWNPEFPEFLAGFNTAIPKCPQQGGME